MNMSQINVEKVARAICEACDENPDFRGDCRGNQHRWEDYKPVAQAAIDEIAGQMLTPKDDLRDQLAAELWATMIERLRKGVADTGELIKSAASINATMNKAADMLEELQRELDNELACAIHSCSPDCTRDGCVNRLLRAQLDQQIVANAALTGENSELFCKLAAAQAETIEQARFVGMGAEREAALLGKVEMLERKLTAAQKDAERLDFATTTPVGKVHHENGRVFATLDWTRATDPECLPDGTKLYAVPPSLDAIAKEKAE